MDEITALAAIKAAAVTVTLNPVTKVYDGNSNASPADPNGSITGLVPGETLTLTVINGKYYNARM